MSASGAWQHTNVTLGGELLATYTPTEVQFALNDWLGTRRVSAGTSGCATQYYSFPYGVLRTGKA